MTGQAANARSGWTATPIGSLADVLVSNVDKKEHAGEIRVQLCNYTDVYYSNAINNSTHFMWATATSDQIKRFTPMLGDVPITKDSESADDIGRPSLVTRDLPGVVYGYHLAIYRPRDTRISGFLRYFFESTKTRFELQVRTPGVTRAGLSLDTLKHIRVPYPGAGSAERIADFLDRETAEIDAFTADYELLLRLAAERRDSLIARKVSGTEDSRMQRCTATPWAPTLSTPHDIVNIRRVAAMRTGHTPSRSSPEYWTGERDIPWFTLADVWQLRAGQKYLGETSENITATGLENSAAELLPKGTVVLSRTASVGFTGIMPRPMATSQDFWNWVCADSLDPEFLWYQFRAMRPEFDRIKSGSTHKTIYQADAAALRIVLPPIEEQRRIVSTLNERDKITSAIVDDAARAITLAKERRTALITAAVTGQIDVTAKRRPAAEQLEDDIKELS